MAVYKIPQDIEAEDKLIGPFTFRQFLYLIIATSFGFFTYRLFSSAPPLAVVTLFPTIMFGILGGYARKDQPIETYLSALIKFFVVPRVRVWDQEGVEHGVTITAPKNLRPLHEARDPREVRGQLKQLSTLMDTRGWSTKRVELQIPTQAPIQHADRLVIPVSNQQDVIDIQAKDDVMDTQNSYIAQNMDLLTQKSHEAQLEHAREIIRQAADEKNMQQTAQQQATARLGHKVVQPLRTDIMNLSENPALNVAELAQQANRLNTPPQAGGQISR